MGFSGGGRSLEGFVKGDILRVIFPFTDFSQKVKRPAFVVKQVSPTDIIFCPITKQSGHSDTSIEIKSEDFDSGSLTHISYVRIDKPVTGHTSIVDGKLGKLTNKKTKDIIDKFIKYIKS